ncbi:MAG: hypothetical protein ABI588_00430 [Arenimonas sp.]
MSQKIVGNFVVGTVYTCTGDGQWNGTWMVRRYGVNNGQVIALQSLPDDFGSLEEARNGAMAKGEEFANALAPEAGDGSSPASGDELFIPPSAQAQRTQPAPN